MNQRPADLLIILAHHVGELDAYFPLIFLLRESRSTWRTKVLVTKKSVQLQMQQSPELLSMMASLEMDSCFVPINALNEPAGFYTFNSMRYGCEGEKLSSRIVGRIRSYVAFVRSIPIFWRELGMHKVISVEGTQYPMLISLVCLIARSGRRALFFHNHSVQPILSLPREKKIIFWKRYAKGIVFSNTDISRYLYGNKLHDKTYRTGLVKYFPRWISFCQNQMNVRNPKAIGIFSKRISFKVYKELLGTLLSRLEQAKWEHPVLIKPHPMDKVKAYSELIAEYPGLNISLTSMPNFAFIPRLQAGICFPGSSILDCDALGVPVIEFRPACETFAAGKFVVTDYADSGYLSTTDVDYVLEWLKLTKEIHIPVRTTRKNQCGENELEALIGTIINSSDTF